MASVRKIAYPLADGGHRRAPILSEHPRKAPPEIKRRVFGAFCLGSRSTRPRGRIEVSATVSEAVARTFQNAEDLPEEGHSGARFIPQSDAPRIVHTFRLAP